MREGGAFGFPLPASKKFLSPPLFSPLGSGLYAFDYIAKPCPYMEVSSDW